MKKKKHVFFSLVCRCCCYCYKLSVQKSFFFLHFKSLSGSLSLSLSICHSKKCTHDSIDLFICLPRIFYEHSMYLIVIGAQQKMSNLSYDLKSVRVFLLFFFSLFILELLYIFFVFLAGWLANGRQYTHVGLNLIRINGKDMRVYNSGCICMRHCTWNINQQ